MKLKDIFLLSLAAVSVAAIALGAVFAWKENREKAVALEASYGEIDLGHVGEFSFLERSGRAVTQKNLEGKIWVAGFIFTSCPSVCPKISLAMEKIQADPALRGLQLVSFTVDPENDTPEVLQKYAQRYHADPDRWIFLTGAQEGLHRFIRDRFKLAVGDAPEDDSLFAMKITHSSRLVLVDGQGKIRGFFDATDPSAARRLGQKAEKLLR